MSRIEFSANGCFGTCPIFSLAINSDRTAIYNAEEYNKVKGAFKTIIKQSNFDTLMQALIKADVPKLKDKYKVSWTDDAGSTLTIIYNNGTRKTIDDYGMQGTKGLERIYKVIYDLRENQAWK